MNGQLLKVWHPIKETYAYVDSRNPTREVVADSEGYLIRHTSPVRQVRKRKGPRGIVPSPGDMVKREARQYRRWLDGHPVIAQYNREKRNAIGGSGLLQDRRTSEIR